MPERTNRRDLIIETAARLFAAHGYATTSTRQIAEAVGCTEAALYYHFPDGKRALLGAVIEDQIPDMRATLETCREAPTLPAALLGFADAHAHRPRALQWLLRELPHLTAEERRFIQRTFLDLRQGLVEILLQFIDDETEADHLAWLVVCASMGYGQIFDDLAFRDRDPLAFKDLLVLLAARWS
jgi:AcrR family transcriptional regulator